MKRGADGEIEYESDGKTPKMIEATEAAALTIQNMRNGKGVAIPFGATLTPYIGKGAAGDQVFPNATNVADRQMEDAGLNQTLAQSEGEHQARAASETAEGRLMDVFFWDKRGIAVMTLYELIAVDFRTNFGDWALKYMPKLSLGDSEKRDWAKDLETIAKAYFYGFIDDTQRAELMAWMSLPRPGPSRAEVLAEQDPTTGEARMPNKNRPDQKPENQGRNDGNSKEKAQLSEDEEAERSIVLAQLFDLQRRYQRAKQITGEGLQQVGHHASSRRRFTRYTA